MVERVLRICPESSPQNHIGRSEFRKPFRQTVVILKEIFASVQLVAYQLICSHLRSKATNHLSLRPRFEAHISNTSAYLPAQDALIFMAHLFRPVALSASHSPQYQLSWKVIICFFLSQSHCHLLP